MNVRLAASLLGLLLALLAAEVRAETFDNDDIIALTKANVGDAALLAKIAGLPCDYDLSVAQIARLKNSGVSNAVIAALIKRCNSAPTKSEVGPATGIYHNRRPGVYISLDLAGFQALEMIVPAYVAAGRSGGNGSLLFPRKSRLSLQGRSSRTVAQSQSPSFVVIIKKKENVIAGYEVSNGGIPRDLEKFKLIRFDAKSNGRTLTVDAVTSLGSYIGPNPARIVPTKVSTVSSGAFRIDLLAPLDAGEYALVADVSDGVYEIYDFRIP